MYEYGSVDKRSKSAALILPNFNRYCADPVSPAITNCIRNITDDRDLAALGDLSQSLSLPGRPARRAHHTLFGMIKVPRLLVSNHAACNFSTLCHSQLSLSRGTKARLGFTSVAAQEQVR